MQRIATLKPDPDEESRRQMVQDDVARLVLAFERDGISISDDVAYAAWRRHSEDSCAGWLSLFGGDKELRQAVLRFLDIIDGDVSLPGDPIFGL